MEYKCKICIKYYKSYQSLWNHTNKFHNNKQKINTKNVQVSQISQEQRQYKNDIVFTKNVLYPTISNKKVQMDNNENITKNVQTISTKVYNCIHCNKIFLRKFCVDRHEINCKYKNDNSSEIKILKEKLEQKDKEFSNYKIQLLDIINKTCKIHPKTLQKINKQLNTINNIVNNTTNNIINNHNIINNNIILKLGNEELSNIFSEKEKINILEKGYKCLDYIIQYTHFNDNYAQFKNILITNLQNNIAYKYDDNTNSFITITKDELLYEVINERMCDINEFYEKYKDFIKDNIRTAIDTFISNMDKPKYEETKKTEIKLIIYNNRDKITREIVKNLEIII